MINSYVILLITFCYLVFSTAASSVENANSTIRDTTNKNIFDSGYIITPGIGAHKYHKTRANWNEARKICISEGAHLAVIYSPLEESIISKHIVEHGLLGSWIGYHDQFKKDDWVTVKDQEANAIGYLHWAEGEPNNAGGNERCVAYSIRLGMNDLNCDQEIGFICKMDLYGNPFFN